MANESSDNQIKKSFEKMRNFAQRAENIMIVDLIK